MDINVRIYIRKDLSQTQREPEFGVGYSWLRGQCIELFYGRQTVSLRYLHLSFLEHAHQLNSYECFLCRMEILKTKHRTSLSFYVSMILFDNVIEVLALSNLDAFVIVPIVLFDSSRVSATLIDVDQTGLSISTNRFD